MSFAPFFDLFFIYFAPFFLMYRIKRTSPHHLPKSLYLEGLAPLCAKRMSRSDNLPYAFLRILAERFLSYRIVLSRTFLYNKKLVYTTWYKQVSTHSLHPKHHIYPHLITIRIFLYPSGYLTFHEIHQLLTNIQSQAASIFLFHISSSEEAIKYMW